MFPMIILFSQEERQQAYEPKTLKTARQRQVNSPFICDVRHFFTAIYR